MAPRRRTRSNEPDAHERARLWQVIAQHLNVIEHCRAHAVVECPAGHRDAWVIPEDRAAFLFCRHEDCAAEVAEINRTLLDALSAAFNAPAHALCTPGDRKRAEAKWLRNQESVARRILLPQFLEQESITADDWMRASPYSLINERVEDHWRLCLELFRPYVDTRASQIWCGRLSDSRGPSCGEHFRSLDDWLNQAESPGPHVCQAIFAEYDSAGISIRRVSCLESKWAKSNPWLVLASHQVPFDKLGHLLLYAQESFGLSLKAVIDTGDNSGQGWFVWPDPPKETDTSEIRSRYPSTRGPDEDPEHWPKGLWSQMIQEMAPLFKQDERAKTAFALRQKRMFATLRGLGYDEELRQFTSTARLPGCIRIDDGDGGTGEPIRGADRRPRWQRLVYLDL